MLNIYTSYLRSFFLEKDYAFFYFDEIDSTNSVTVRNLKTLNKKSVFLTNKQTAGYGKKNAAWLSPPGNIYLTITYMVQFHTELERASLLCAQAIYSVINSVKIDKNLEIIIKQPNDILINSRKVIGILPELHLYNGCYYLLLGIGINWQILPDERFIVINKYLNIDYYNFLTRVIMEIEKSFSFLLVRY